MKKGNFFLLLFAFLFSSFSYKNEENILKNTKKDGVEPCYIQNTTFQDGEQLTYKIYYNWNFVWIPAGEVNFKVTDKGDFYRISATGKTYESYEWFYKVRDYYETDLDKSSMLPVVSVRDVKEGKYNRYDKVVFDQSNHKATSYQGPSKNDTNRKDFNVQDCVHDILSAVYYTRNIDYNEYRAGTEFPVKIFLDRELNPLKFKYRGKEKGKNVHNMGKYNTIRFTPQVVADRVFKDGTEMNIWVSDDKNRIPVLIESPVSVGSVKVVLKDYRGLKYDFTAKN